MNSSSTREQEGKDSAKKKAYKDPVEPQIEWVREYAWQSMGSEFSNLMERDAK